ncbi:MAG: magnesium and cobalt transport protein CorA, partial [Flammeovirgaceae bacterium]|nr:magnesium and cobalt transport protein CorA [Flammeovirgaceae bacterium]
LEGSLNTRNTDHTFQKIQSLKKELIYLRKAVFPLREALGKIVKEESVFIEEDNIRYFSDLYDHIIHLTDSLDTYKDLTAGLLDYHINIQNQRMNEVMKLLTVITTIFIPLSFIAGIYGMNFEFMPELSWTWGYPMVLIIMAAVMISMIVYFKFRKWF